MYQQEMAKEMDSLADYQQTNTDLLYPREYNLDSD